MSVPSKHAAKEAKPRVDGCNGLKLSLSGGRLPFVLEKSILMLADGEDLASLLRCSVDMRQLVHDFLRSTTRLNLEIDPRRMRQYGGDLNENQIKGLLRAVRAHSSRLQELALVEVSSMLDAECLIAVLVANAGTLRVLTGLRGNWPPSVVDAISQCSELRELSACGPFDATSSARIAQGCRKLEKLDFCFFSQQAVTGALAVPLPLTELRLPSHFDPSASVFPSSLRSLDLNSLDKPEHSLRKYIVDVFPRLTKLETLKLDGGEWSGDRNNSAKLELSLRRLRKLAWRFAMTPALNLPELEELDFLPGFRDPQFPRDVMKSLRRSPKLRVVRVSGHKHQRLKQTEELGLVQDDAGNCCWPQLEKWEVTAFSYSASFIDVWARFTKLREVELHLHSVGPADVQHLLSRILTLEYAGISLDQQAREDAKARTGWRPAFSTPLQSLKRLENLSLSIADDALLTAFELPSLTRLELGGNLVALQHFERCLALMPCLQRIELPAPDIKLTARCQPPLAHLHSIDWILSDGARNESLAGLLQSSPNVRHISLTNGSQFSEQPDPTPDEWITSVTSLQLPKLDRLYLDALDAKGAAQLIRTCPAMTHLSARMSIAECDKLKETFRGQTRAVRFWLEAGHRDSSQEPFTIAAEGNADSAAE